MKVNDTADINGELSDIQTIISRLKIEDFKDQWQAISLLSEISSIASNASHKIEDVYAQIGWQIFKGIGKDMVLLKELAPHLGYKGTIAVYQCTSRLKRGIRKGVLPVIRKRQRLYATKETVAAYFKNSRQLQ